MFVHKIKSGDRKQYLKLLLRRNDRIDGKVKTLTLANLSGWTDGQVAYLEHLLAIRRQSTAPGAKNPEVDRLILQMLMANLPGHLVWRVFSEPIG